MSLSRRGLVILLAVLLAPLLRFIDLDAHGRAYAVEGLSQQDAPGVAVDRKERVRFLSRARAMQPTDDKLFQDDAGDLPAMVVRIGQSTSSVSPAAAEPIVAYAVPRGTPQARGPPA